MALLTSTVLQGRHVVSGAAGAAGMAHVPSSSGDQCTLHLACCNATPRYASPLPECVHRGTGSQRGLVVRSQVRRAELLCGGQARASVFHAAKQDQRLPGPQLRKRHRADVFSCRT